MRIVIVGAGIAGLTLAVALRRHGIGATVLEQAQRPRLLGAGVQITPNASRPLLRLGLGEALERAAVRPRSRELLHWRDGSHLESMPLGESYEARFGAPYYTMLRSDLHEALLAQVPSESVWTGHYVTDVLDATDAITLRCADGREVYADVVVAADGIHSAVRAVLSPGDAHRFSGLSVCRGLAPASRGTDGVPRVRVWLGPDRHFSCYPVEGGRTVSFSATIPSEHLRPDSWSPQSRIGDLRSAFAGWDEEVLKLVAAAEWIGVWALHERDPAREWHRGRIALMGDAAHPMMPFFAQGATQAVEDAVVLARCLRSATWETVEEALGRYTKARRDRVERVQELSMNLVGMLRHAGQAGAQGSALLAERERAEADWVYGHDAESDEPVQR